MINLVASLIAAGLVLITTGSVRAQQCEQELRACEFALADALSNLAAAQRDSDGDRVRDVDDACPSTPAGVAIDARGCSQDQFCSRQSAVETRARRTCRRLDWQNDEPEKATKRDCTVLRDPASGDMVCRAASGPDRDDACVSVELLLTFPADQYDVVGVTLSLGYPAGVSIPGILDEPRVFARVQNRTGISNGLFGVSDVEDYFSQPTLQIGLISLQQPIPPGPFALVAFDCVADQPRPTANDFACLTDVSDAFGITVPTDCRVVLR